MIRTSAQNLTEMLIRHEGMRLSPYRCTAGKLTIGIGRNLYDVGITEEEARFLLSNDIKRVLQEAVIHFPWFQSLNLARQDAVLDMLFNLGLSRFMEFQKMIAALGNQNYNLASQEMLNSEWSNQVKFRAQEIAQIMRTGNYPILG